MNKNIYVVTYPENGWDCVGDIYKAESKEDVYKYIAKERGVDVNDDNLRNTVLVHQKYKLQNYNDSRINLENYWIK